MIGNTVISFIRTYVPILAGLILTWVAEQTGVIVSDTTSAGVTALCVALVSAAWYALARLLEHWKPSLGWLLGVPKTPTYS